MDSTNCTTVGLNAIRDPDFEAWKPLRVAVLIIFSFSITFLNCTVLVLYFRLKKTSHRKIHDIMLINQAFGDLFNGVLEVPVKILEIFNVRVAADILDHFVVFSTIVSELMYLLIMADRCLSVTKPMLHRRKISMKMVEREFVAVWITALVLSVLPLTWKYSVSCQHVREISTMYSFCLTALVVVLFLVIVILVSITYNSALRWIKRNKKKSQNHCTDVDQANENNSEDAMTEIRMILAMCLMICFYCVMYIPIIVMTLMAILGVGFSSVKDFLILSDVSLFLYLTSSVFNPIVTLKIKFKDRICGFLSKREQSTFSSNAQSLETL